MLAYRAFARYLSNGDKVRNGNEFIRRLDRPQESMTMEEGRADILALEYGAVGSLVAIVSVITTGSHRSSMPSARESA